VAEETATELIGQLAALELLPTPRLNEVRIQVVPGCATARALAAELIRRDWLTPLQANKLLQGMGKELVVGAYRVLERLGGGGMGEVYKARDTRSERTVALKVINRERLTSPTAVERFLREVKAVSQLNHPNIVNAYDSGRVGDLHYFAMEYVEGLDLARLAKDHGPLPIAQACDTIRQAALGLQHAHEKGLVHRDLKPANLLVSGGGSNGSTASGGRHHVKILDFGLARFASEEKAAGHLTQVGRIIGTVDYMSPEQAGDPRGADIRSDIFSLGCCLFYALTGRPPFLGADMVERLAARVLGEAPLLRTLRPDAPAALESIVATMLARDPRRRFALPADAAAALQPFCSAQVQALQAARPQAVAVPVNPTATHVRPAMPTRQPSPAFGHITERPAPSEPLIVRPSARRSRAIWRWAALACVLLVAAAGGTAFVLSNAPNDEPVVKAPPPNFSVPERKPAPPAETPLPTKPERKSTPPSEPSPKQAPPELVQNPEPRPQPKKPAEPKLVRPPQAPVEAKPALEEPKPGLHTTPAPAKPEPTSDPRIPVPEGKVLVQAKETVYELYKDDFRKTKHSEMSELAKTLLEQAENSLDQPVLRYVLLREAQRLAVRAADAVLALRAIDQLDRDYAVDGEPMRWSALERAVNESLTAGRAAQLAELILGRQEEALAADKYFDSVRLAKLAEQAARRSTNSALISTAVTRRQDAEAVLKAYGEIKSSFAVLAQNSDDPEANLAVGRFYCLVRGDWIRGLANLELGGEGQLQDLARKEIAAADSPDSQVQAAKSWRELARTERGTTARQQIQLHALSLLRKSLPQLAGVNKPLAEKYIAELEKELPKERLHDGPYGRFKGHWRLRYTNNVIREYVIDDQGNVQQVVEASIQAPQNQLKAPRPGKLSKRGNDVVLDFSDNTFERLTVKGSELHLDHYNPAALYPKGRASLTAIGVKKR
jgi:serine/threonine protein kinase